MLVKQVGPIAMLSCLSAFDGVESDCLSSQKQEKKLLIIVIQLGRNLCCVDPETDYIWLTFDFLTLTFDL